MNAREVFKKKLINCKTTIGSWLQIGHPVTAEIMAQAGFDWLVVDLEHSAIDISTTQVLFQIIESKGIIPLVRLSSNDNVEIKRVLDAGAAGIIVPNVNTADQAKEALCSSMYPPIGKRGTGIARSQGYGSNFKEYFDRANKEMIVIAQIEHKDALSNIDSILETDIDGILIGPYDISASLGVAGGFDNPLVVEAVSKIKAAAKKHNKSLGVHIVYPRYQEVEEKINQGFNFIAYSTDAIILQDYTSSSVERINNMVKGKVKVKV
ncbi:MAG: aldolase/citrate lyase family protein [Candidatus Omnitrophota bacterium]